jgi:hypothetical protein
MFKCLQPLPRDESAVFLFILHNAMVFKKGHEKEETILGGGRSFQSDGRTLRGKLNAT